MPQPQLTSLSLSLSEELLEEEEEEDEEEDDEDEEELESCWERSGEVIAQRCAHMEQVYLYPPLMVKVINGSLNDWVTTDTLEGGSVIAAVAGGRREGLLKHLTTHKRNRTSNHFTKKTHRSTHTRPFQLCCEPIIAKVTVDRHYKQIHSTPSSLLFHWLLLGAAHTVLPSSVRSHNSWFLLRVCVSCVLHMDQLDQLTVV